MRDNNGRYRDRMMMSLSERARETIKKWKPIACVQVYCLRSHPEIDFDTGYWQSLNELYDSWVAWLEETGRSDRVMPISHFARMLAPTGDVDRMMARGKIFIRGIALRDNVVGREDVKWREFV